MASRKVRRKYSYFIVGTSEGNEVVNSYQSAVQAYHFAESATLYGVNWWGDMSVIYSK